MVHICDTIVKLRETIKLFKKRISTQQHLDYDKVKVGFVPTMGYLHKGHITLVEHAKRDCQIRVVSIFVNPTQFAPTEDLASYPSDIKSDCDLLNQVDTDIILFLPSVNEMYPNINQLKELFNNSNNSNSNGNGNTVQVNQFTDLLMSSYVEIGSMKEVTESISRPGHFRGVATVVTKLMNIVQPDKMYIGQKDAMQCVCIRRLIEDLNFGIDLVIVDTVREDTGLAMSSRNSYLTKEEKLEAAVIYQSLVDLSKIYRTLSRLEFTSQLTNMIEQRCSKLVVQYISVARPQDGLELGPDDSIPPNTIISLAAFFNGVNRKTRLIDVYILN